MTNAPVHGPGLPVPNQPGRESELTDSIQERDAFFARLSHELRNPLHALALQIASIRRDAAQCGQADLAARLSAAEGAMAQYLDQATVLLDLARREARDYPVNPTRFDFSRRVTDLIGKLEPEAQFHGVKLVGSLPGALQVCLDPFVAELLLSNLLLGAIKRAHGRTLRVAVARSARGRVRLSAEIETEPSERVGSGHNGVQQHSARASGSPSGGLEPSLSPWLVNQLVEVLKGELTIDRRSGDATRWTVSLPLGLSNSEKTNSSHEPRCA